MLTSNPQHRFHKVPNASDDGLHSKSNLLNCYHLLLDQEAHPVLFSSLILAYPTYPTGKWNRERFLIKQVMKTIKQVTTGEFNSMQLLQFYLSMALTLMQKWRLRDSLSHLGSVSLTAPCHTYQLIGANCSVLVHFLFSSLEFQKPSLFTISTCLIYVQSIEKLQGQ